MHVKCNSTLCSEEGGRDREREREREKESDRMQTN